MVMAGKRTSNNGKKAPSRASLPEPVPTGTPIQGFDPGKVLSGSYRSVQRQIQTNVTEGVWGLYEIVALHTVEGQQQKRKTLLEALVKLRDGMVGLAAKVPEPEPAKDAPGRDLPPCPEGVSMETWIAIQAPAPSERLYIQKFGRYWRLVKGKDILGHYQQPTQAEHAKRIYETTGKIT